MPGVFRPYNLVDVLGTINDQSAALIGSAQMITTLGAFAEADETLGASDVVSATTQLASVQTWDSGTNWGAFSWG